MPSRCLICIAALVASLATAATKAPSRTFCRTIERVSSLDPVDSASAYSSRCVALLYETLIEYDYTARPYRLKPALARSLPDVSPDGLTYTFHLATNAFFTEDACFGLSTTGRPLSRRVVASDVVYSFKRLADAKLASSGFWLINGRIEGIDSFRVASRDESPTDYSLPVSGLSAPDDETFVLRLSRPSPVFHWMLAMPYLSIVPREAVEFYGTKFREHPVGSGAYRLANWRRNYKMLFSRNTAWRGWRGIEGIPFDELLFQVIDDTSTQWLCFLAGQLDLQGEVSRDNWDEAVTEDGTIAPELDASGITMHKTSTLEVSYIGINMDDPLLGTNKFLRQALNAAFDTVRWEKFYRGRATASSTPVPPSVGGHLARALPYGRGVETAAGLLEKAGYKGGYDAATGRRLRLVIDLGKTTQDIRESTELLTAFMNRCGVEFVAEYHSMPTFLKKISQRRSQLFRITWVGDYPDAENFLQLFYGPNASPGPNRCNYSNPEFDKLYRAAMETTDKSERLALYKKMQELIQEDSPWIFMSFATSLSLCGPNLRNYAPHDFPYGMEKHFRVNEESEKK